MTKKALLDEFYSVAFRKKQYERIEELQIGLGNFMDGYYYRRTDRYWVKRIYPKN
jgi:hypothetical protein